MCVHTHDKGSQGGAGAGVRCKYLFWAYHAGKGGRVYLPPKGTFTRAPLSGLDTTPDKLRCASPLKIQRDPPTPPKNKITKGMLVFEPCLAKKPVAAHHGTLQLAEIGVRIMLHNNMLWVYSNYAYRSDLEGASVDNSKS